MNSSPGRLHSFKGTPYEIGFAAGRTFGKGLESSIHQYLAHLEPVRDMQKVHEGAIPWLRGLPQRFQEEFEGMAEGAGIPLQLLAEWSYIEECEPAGCSGAVILLQEQAWVARNNDLYVPELWGHAVIREVKGRIPTIGFGMQGDVFVPTGINKEKLWLHYNYLPAWWDKPTPGKPHMPAFAFLTEALELCRTIDEVQALLGQVDRDGGMLLFAVDGKNNEYALFDCACSRHYRREPHDGWIVGTNHYCAVDDPTLTAADEAPMGTVSRFRRMEQLVQALCASSPAPELPADLIRILADVEIERVGPEVVTVYSNVACPATGEIWYTFGGHPAASQGNWQRLAWPWSG